MRLFLWAFLFVTALLLAYTLALRFSENKQSVLLSPIGQTVKQIEFLIAPSSLKQVVESQLKRVDGAYGVVIKNLKTGESFVRQENRKFDSASLYKLWVMAETFRQIEVGTIDKTTLMEEKRSVLYAKHKIATDSADFKDEEIKMTVEEALEQMITISDNDAALLLSARVRLSNVKQMLKNEGFAHSTIAEPPTTTPGDITLFFEKLYKGELISNKASEEMLAILSRQRLNDRIPKHLPKDTRIAHKTGELDGYKHDAGIVYFSKGDYIIVMMSKTGNPKEAVKRMANLSAAVYTYFNE